MGLQYGATAIGAYMGVHLTTQLFMLMMQGSYVFSGKDEDVDLLLLKAESAARSRWCYLTETDACRLRHTHMGPPLAGTPTCALAHSRAHTRTRAALLPPGAPRSCLQ
jgi:hypothetical protein